MSKYLCGGDTVVDIYVQLSTQIPSNGVGGIRDQGSGIRDQGSGIRDLFGLLHDGGTGINLEPSTVYTAGMDALNSMYKATNCEVSV